MLVLNLKINLGTIDYFISQHMDTLYLFELFKSSSHLILVSRAF